MTITAQDARDEYTATAGQTIFNYTFKIYSDTELDVYITPSGQEADDSADLTTAYTVDPSTIGSELGGFITLDSGTNSGDLVTVVSGMPYNRTVDYQNSGDFLPDTVNGDNDRQVSQIKQVADLANRSLLFPQSLQNASSLSLPLPDAGLYLKWKSDESGLENTGVPGQIIPGTNVGLKADMVADTSLVVGDFVFTTGYVSSGDGGDNSYEIEADTGQTVDDFQYILLATGDIAKGLFPRGIRTVRQAGAVGDGAADDTVAIQACLDARVRIQVPPGLYRTTTELVWDDYSSLVGPAVFDGNRHISFGNTYDPDYNAIIFYDGAGGVNSCVLRLSRLAVGVEIIDLATDDLIAAEVSGLVVDANNKAEIGVYMYRPATIKYDTVVATQALKHGQLMLGTFNGYFKDMIAYNNGEMGITIGKNVFSWASQEWAINSIHVDGLTARNNGSAKTFDDATNQGVGHGAYLALGRGVIIDNMNCESNDGAGFYLEGQSTTGSTVVRGVYTEGNMPVAAGEGRSPATYEAYAMVNRLMTGIRLTEAFISPSSSARFRLLTDGGFGEIVDPSQVFIIDNCGSREVPLVIQSSTNMYRLQGTLADTSFGVPPLFHDGSNVIAEAIFTLDNPVSSVVTKGMIEDTDIVYSGATGIADVTFAGTLPSDLYIVNCEVASSSKISNATNLTDTGFEVQLRDLTGTLINGFQVRLTVRLIV